MFQTATTDTARSDVVVIDLRDSTADTAATERLKVARTIALASLVVLNIADLVTTRLFLAAGTPEGNPLASALLGRGVMPYVKGAVLLGLGWSVLRSKPKLGTTCALWFIVGIYTAAVCVNAMSLSAVS